MQPATSDTPSSSGLWRVSSGSYMNLALALDANTWGAAWRSALKRVEVGDYLALYSSVWSQRGFWALATVTRALYRDTERIWPDGYYPFRIGFELTHRRYHSPVPREQVLDALGQTQFTVRQPRSLLRLTPEEFRVIADAVVQPEQPE
jgi:hypothetical protein